MSCPFHSVPPLVVIFLSPSSFFVFVILFHSPSPVFFFFLSPSLCLFSGSPPLTMVTRCQGLIPTAVRRCCSYMQ